jgi:hypothetical protein
MEEVLQFFRAYEIWIYVLLGLGGLIYFRKFVSAWQDLRGAVFGLERQSAQGRLNTAASMMVLLLILAASEFALVTYVAPAFPEASPPMTPTLDLLATATPTLSTLPAGTAEAQFALTENETRTPPAPGQGCIPGQLLITSPTEGSEISGVVAITGTVNIPNFGFYKLEMKRPEESDWLTILAGNEVKIDATLGFWNTSLLPPGIHQLGLVATDNQGQSLPPCVIQVVISHVPSTNQP